MQALLVDGYAHLRRFNGTSWTDLGPEPHSGFIEDLDIDAAGNIWMCGTGTGGVFRRDAETGFWQRYRVTNTSQFDFFNNDVAIDPHTGDVYACANASPGIGGMVKFDGTRWTGFVNEVGYGLTGPWPWPGAPQSEAVYVRPSNGHVVANPINQFTHEFDGTSWTQLPGGSDQMRQYVEDSLGRLWGIGHYGGLGIFENGGYTLVGTGGWSGSSARPGSARDRLGNEGWKLLRTDGGPTPSRRDRGLPGTHAELLGLPGPGVGPNGIAGSEPRARRRRADSDRRERGHPPGLAQRSRLALPGDEHVYPLTVTPDGRVWMGYNSGYPSINAGLLWWDGTHVGVFPAPPNGEWQWGGLPHASSRIWRSRSSPAATSCG